MADQPVENLLYEFLAENIGEFGTALEIHTSAYETRHKDRGIVIGDAESEMLPDGNGDSMKEFDATLALEIYSKVEGQDKDLRIGARQAVFDIKTSLLKLFEKYPTLDARGCRIRILDQVRYFESYESEPYAVEIVPVVFNPFNS